MNPLNPNVPTAVDRLRRLVEQRKGLIESMTYAIARTTKDRDFLIDEVADMERQLRAATACSDDPKGNA